MILIYGGIYIDYYKFGNKGIIVKNIQILLHKLGYDIEIDGIYGQNTRKAVIHYQSKHHLKIDGIVGPNTFESLLLSNGKNAAEAYINSRDFYSKTNYLIYTNLDTHIVSIFKGNNKNWNLIKEFLATVGKPETPTVKGIFSVKAKGTGYINKEYGFKVKWYTQFYKNYLFHSILYNLDDTVYDGRLGLDLSDGCIRLKEEDAKYIYEYIPYGTLVIIK